MLRILMSGAMAKARKRPEKAELHANTEWVSRAKSIITWKAIPNVVLYMVEVSAQVIRIRYAPKKTFSRLPVLSGSFSLEIMVELFCSSSSTSFLR